MTLIFDQNKHKHFKILNQNKKMKRSKSISSSLDRPVGRVGEGFQGCPLPRRLRQGDALAQDGPARGQNSGRIMQTNLIRNRRFLNILGCCLLALSPEFETKSQRAATRVTVFSPSAIVALPTPQLGLTTKTPSHALLTWRLGIDKFQVISKYLLC